MPKALQLLVNGIKRHVLADPSTSLLEALRDDLGLTGAKYGCGEGQCGACTVLADGQPVGSCLMPISACVGKKLLTLEGLEKGGKLHPLQEAFLAEDAMQCGYCTSGMILTAYAMLSEKPSPTASEVKSRMSGNFCRCCTYPRIVAAILRAAKAMKGGS